ncbi:hypothetical protein BDP55DRAFT_670079 [Colletotrichum godetiae]|uniref:Uncharacterized protein n=1 Tax=Colletotrichum godetiae TaxID=1209918 RepID=A0AAJ0AHH9_9PEZI|nr:uncharacterized protein BDP55DRAFT_670079 [Colletotrichum godetiae]KAK1673385.1 hypothetical protein BDP55DRAFT_670079 [Colletotrichum godetiae]
MPRSLPRHREDLASKDNSPGTCKASNSQQNQGARPDHHFLLLCIPFMRWGTRAHQPDVCGIRSDQNFFRLLRASYDANRSGYPWSWLKKVKFINFVKFELLRNELVNISDSAFLPIGPGFECERLDTEPIIGFNLMMHLFENPDRADIFPVLFKRIPRKMRKQLQPCPIRGGSTGWGIQFVESLNELYVFLFGCVGFLVCLGISVTWTVIHDDIQGGFAIGGFVLAFILFCGGVLHSYAA